jgi:hypothetical protein
VAERNQLAQLRAFTTRYHLLRNGHLDGMGSRVPHLPRPVYGRLVSLFGFFSERQALARLQPQFAGSLALPDSLWRQSPGTQQQWLEERPLVLSNIGSRESYVLNEVADSLAASFFVRSTPNYYALGQGRYWLPQISVSYGRDSADYVILALPLREGTFRLQANYVGDTLKLQQRATGTWQTQLSFALRAPTDSLLRHYGRIHNRTVNLSAPQALRAHARRLHLQLFLLALTRDGADQHIRYSYSAQGELRIEP